MKFLLFACIVAALSPCAFAQADSTRPAAHDSLPPERVGLQQLTEYLNLTPGDITYRSDYTEPDSFRLKQIAEMMRRPLDMIDYTATVRKSYVKGQPDILPSMLFGDLAGEYQTKRGRAYQPTAEELQHRYDLYYGQATMNEFLSRAAAYVNVIFPRSAEKELGKLTPRQQKFLYNEFKELLTEHVEEQYYSVEQLDSVEKAEEKYTDTFLTFGSKVDKDPLLDASINCLRELLPIINQMRQMVDSGPASTKRLLSTAAYLPKDANLNNYLGLQPGWKIGGPGNDVYTGDYGFILDLGGDDVYNLSYDPAHPHSTIIIDLGGDDHYVGKTDFTIGAGCFGAGILLDFGGNDRYDAKSFSIGAGYFGFGLVYDASGDDRYDGDTFVEGASAFGMGILIDESGRDLYNAALYSQAFGFTQGMGILYDVSGSDSYYAGGKYLDVLRYDVHYLSLSQGFAYGLRPWMSGGIGALIDLKGNDTYNGDIFAQWASYWWSLGVLYDSSGNDNYQAYQYGQGTGTHMTLGILVDDWGDDVYFGKGLMQGVGHDYSCGIILDRHGNDAYTGYDLSQGGGSANGAGVLIDNQGDDRYFIKNPKNTQGFGDARRDFGSIGLFIDLGGKDDYFGNGKDNFYWQTDSKWGGGMDIELYPKADTTGGKK